MRSRGLRRLPVVDLDGHLIGLLSLDDIVKWGVDGDGISSSDIVETLKAIIARRPSTTDLAAADL
jgi:hypothetical protein